MELDERKESITNAISFIHDICMSFEMTLIAKNKNGKNYVAIKDNITGEHYVMVKEEQ